MYRTEGHDCTSIWEQEASVSATRVVRQTGGVLNSLSDAARFARLWRPISLLYSSRYHIDNDNEGDCEITRLAKTRQYDQKNKVPGERWRVL